MESLLRKGDIVDSKKNIWILNHYATIMYRDKGGRHYSFAKKLIERGHKVTIFCASTFHNSKKIINIDNKHKYTQKNNGVPYVFIKTEYYHNNGLKRIKNILDFYFNFIYVAKRHVMNNKKPDIIYASSVHPLTLIAGIRIAKKFNIPCICEIRDLWPKTLVDSGILKENNIFTRLLYKGEYWIYKKSNSLVFTMEGGKDYIVDKGWSIKQGKRINLSKVFHINNGIDTDTFNYNKQNYKITDNDLNDKESFKIVYVGSIRKVNNVENILNVAKKLKDYNIKFLIWGSGNSLEYLKNKCIDEDITNVIFKGKVEKKYIPYIVSNSDVNMMNGIYFDVLKYGISPNKLFDYFAARKPILSNLKCGYDLIKKYNVGITVEKVDIEEIKKAVLKLYNSCEIKKGIYSSNFNKINKVYSFENLTDKLEDIIKITLKKYYINGCNYNKNCE